MIENILSAVEDMIVSDYSRVHHAQACSMRRENVYRLHERVVSTIEQDFVRATLEGTV